jgi:hypothetical protein
VSGPTRANVYTITPISARSRSPASVVVLIESRRCRASCALEPASFRAVRRTSAPERLPPDSLEPLGRRPASQRAFESRRGAVSLSVPNASAEAPLYTRTLRPAVCRRVRGQFIAPGEELPGRASVGETSIPVPDICREELDKAPASALTRPGDHRRQFSEADTRDIGGGPLG